jgi:biopolymer transport protein ExbD
MNKLIASGVLLLITAAACPASELKDPRTVTVVISATGVIRLGGSQVSADGLTRSSTNVVHEFGNSVPFHFTAEPDAAFRSIWAAVTACREAGVYRFSFLAPGDSTSEASHRYPFFAPYAAPHSGAPDGVVITNLESIIRIAVSTGSVVVAGRPMTDGQCETILMKLASLDRNMPLLIIPDTDISYRRLMWIMERCERVGLHNVSITPAFRTAQQGAPEVRPPAAGGLP